MSKRLRQSKTRTIAVVHGLHQLLGVSDLCDELHQHMIEEPCVWFVLQALDRACAALVGAHIRRMGRPYLLVWCRYRACIHQHYVRRCCCPVCRASRRVVSPLTDGVFERMRGVTFRLHKVRIGACELVDGTLQAELDLWLAWTLYWGEKSEDGAETNHIILDRRSKYLYYENYAYNSWHTAQDALLPSLVWERDLSERIAHEKTTIGRVVRSYCINIRS